MTGRLLMEQRLVPQKQKSPHFAVQAGENDARGCYALVAGLRGLALRFRLFADAVTGAQPSMMAGAWDARARAGGMRRSCPTLAPPASGVAVGIAAPPFTAHRPGAPRVSSRLQVTPPGRDDAAGSSSRKK